MTDIHVGYPTAEGFQPAGGVVNKTELGTFVDGRIPAPYTLPAYLAQPALNAAYPVKWSPSTAYAAGQEIISPDNDLVSALSAHTSGTAFNKANWSPAGVHVTNIPIRYVGNRFRSLTVVTYHSIALAAFQNDLDFYQEWNYKTVTISDVQAHYDGTATLPDKPLLITFDDGIPTQYTNVQELNNRGMKSTLFVATGWIDGTVTQAQGGFAEATPLTWAQIVQMKAWGCDIQSHTVSHSDQQLIPTAQVASEFTASKARIEAQVPGQTVSHMAYPYGSWNEGVKAALLGAGCKLARIVRIGTDGTYPGANRGRLAIGSTLSPRLEIPTSATGNGDIQAPNYYRSTAHETECVADYGFEAGGKGWSLGTGFSIDTADFQTGTKSLKFTQGATTASSKPLRAIHAGRWCRFQIRAWVKTVGLPAGALTKIQVQQLKADASVISTIDAVTITGNNGAWTEYVYELVGDPACDSIVIYAFGQGSGTPSGAAWYDNISVKRENMGTVMTGY